MNAEPNQIPKMKSTIPIRKYSIEDALARALPLDAWGWDSEEGLRLVRKFVRKGLDEVVVGTRGRCGEASKDIQNTVLAEVDLDEYFELYERLLNNPDLFQKYLNILDSDARNYVLNDSRASEMRNPVHYLFGIFDHASLYVDFDKSPTRQNKKFWELNEYKEGLYNRITDIMRNPRMPPINPDIPRTYFSPHSVHYEGEGFSSYASSRTQSWRIDLMSQTRIPTASPQNDRYTFDDLRDFINSLRGSRFVTMVRLDPGDRGVVLPTYHRK